MVGGTMEVRSSRTGGGRPHRGFAGAGVGESDGGRLPGGFPAGEQNLPLFHELMVGNTRRYTTQLQAGLGLVPETKTLLELWTPGKSAAQLFAPWRCTPGAFPP